MNTQITFNETTYRFNYYEGKGQNNETYECYGIYKNGQLDTDYFLEEGTATSGAGKGKVVEKIYLLYWKSFYAGMSIKDFSLLEVAKLINYINTNK